MNGRDDTTTFLLLDSKTGGQVSHDRPNAGQFLTREQANYVYKKVETGKMIDTNTIQQEIQQEEQLNKMDDMNRETNPYQELIVNNTERIEPLMMQMEQWLILSNVLNYIQHDKHHAVNHTLNITAMNKYRNTSEIKQGKEPLKLDFGGMPLKLCN